MWMAPGDGHGRWLVWTKWRSWLVTRGAGRTFRNHHRHHTYRGQGHPENQTSPDDNNAEEAHSVFSHMAPDLFHITWPGRRGDDHTDIPVDAGWHFGLDYGYSPNRSDCCGRSDYYTHYGRCTHYERLKTRFDHYALNRKGCPVRL